MKSKSYTMLLGLAVALFVQAGSAGQQPPLHAARKVKLLRVPNGGIQPQAALDERGVLHMVYFTGEPQGGDIYYVRRNAGEAEFTSPLRVNSEPGSAVGIGTIRGAQLAVGRNGRVHVAWNGRHDSGGRGAPMLYARMNDARTRFDPQINDLLAVARRDKVNPRATRFLRISAGLRPNGKRKDKMIRFKARFSLAKRRPDTSYGVVAFCCCLNILTSRPGGLPNMRAYSRLNCEGLS